MSFQEMGLMDAVVHGVQSLGFVEPTPVQERCIPLILQGRDVIGSAQTGTGKTAAFALPILSRLKERRGPRCLVLEPTRELALQVETAFQYYARFTEIEIGVVYGGVGYDRQKKLIQFGVDVVVATPGRLLDLQQQGLLRLDQIEILVLDEGDRIALVLGLAGSGDCRDWGAPRRGRNSYPCVLSGGGGSEIRSAGRPPGANPL